MVMVVTYLMNFRLQWGKHDNLSLLPSALNAGEPEPEAVPVTDHAVDPHIRKVLPALPENAPRYFTADTPSEYISIIQNDWPYSGETDAENACYRQTNYHLHHPKSTTRGRTHIDMDTNSCIPRRPHRQIGCFPDHPGRSLGFHRESDSSTIAFDAANLFTGSR